MSAVMLLCVPRDVVADDDRAVAVASSIQSVILLQVILHLSRVWTEKVKRLSSNVKSSPTCRRALLSLSLSLSYTGERAFWGRFFYQALGVQDSRENHQGYCCTVLLLLQYSIVVAAAAAMRMSHCARVLLCVSRRLRRYFFVGKGIPFGVCVCTRSAQVFLGGKSQEAEERSLTDGAEQPATLFQYRVSHQRTLR